MRDRYDRTGVGHDTRDTRDTIAITAPAPGEVLPAVGGPELSRVLESLFAR